MEKIIMADEMSRAMSCQAKFNARETLTFFIASGTFGYCSDGTFTFKTIQFWNYLKPMLDEQEGEIAKLAEKLVATVTGKKELRLRHCSRSILQKLCEHYMALNSDSYLFWEKLANQIVPLKSREKGKIEFDLWTFISGGKPLQQLKAISALVLWPQMVKALDKAELAHKKAEHAHKKAVEALESLDALTPAERHEAKKIILAGL